MRRLLLPLVGLTAIVATLILAVVSGGFQRQRFNRETEKHRKAIERVEQLGGRATKVNIGGKDRVRVEFIPFNVDHLTPLAHIENLTQLSLHGVPFTNDYLPHVCCITELRTLDLGATRITDDGLASLQKLTNLEDLNLSDTAITDVGLLRLARLQALKRLVIVNTKVTAAGIKRLLKLHPKLVVVRQR